MENTEPSNSLDELFSTAPFDLTDGQILQIVLNLRAKRENWLAAEKVPKAAKVKAEPKAAPIQLDLGDLGL